MSSYDCSLEEVWEWKEKVYQVMKDFTPVEYLEKLNGDAMTLMMSHGVMLRLSTHPSAVPFSDRNWRQRNKSCALLM